MKKTLLTAAIVLLSTQSYAEESKAPSMTCSYSLTEVVKTVRNRRGKIKRKIRAEVVRKLDIQLNDDDRASLAELAKNDNCEAVVEKNKKGEEVAVTDVNGKALKSCALEGSAQLSYYRRINNRQNRTAKLGKKDLVLSKEMRVIDLTLNADNQIVGINLDESKQSNGKQDSIKTATKLSKKGSKLEFTIKGRKGRSRNACSALELAELQAEQSEDADKEAEQSDDTSVVEEAELI